MSHSLHHGDCLEVMKSIPDGSVDMVLCDLPYGTTACKWDVVIPFEPLWKQYWRVIKPKKAILLFGTEPFSSALRMSQIRAYKYDWVWDKVKPNGHLVAKKRPMQRTETVSVFGNGSVQYFPVMVPRGRGKISKEYSRTKIMGGAVTDSGVRVLKEKYPTNVLVFSNASQKDKLHPTQKPVPLLEYLIKTYTGEGDAVLDNCMGSGSTGVACLNTGRRFIGIEQDPEYFEIAKRRIESVRRDGRVAEGAPLLRAGLALAWV